MRNLAFIAMLVAFSAVRFTAVGVSAQRVDVTGTEAMVDQEHQKWIEYVLKSLSAIKPGMMRKDLTPLLVEDGGLQTRQYGRYRYAQCESIKVDVTFLPVDRNAKDNLEDKIVKVSRPYLESPYYD